MISNTEIKQVQFRTNLERLKKQAHEYFDMLWRLKYISRDEAYVKLAEWLGVDEPQAHISKASCKQCKDVIEYSIMILNDIRRLDLDFGAEIKTPYFEIVTPKKTKKQLA